MAHAFTGREHELRELNRLYAKRDFEMVVLYGRRRVGKTTLAFEFAKGKPTIAFTAKVQSDALNLADFSRTIFEHFSLPDGGSFPSWENALAFLAKQAGDSQLVFVFDEFPYAASKNQSLISTLQVAIDHALSRTRVFLILTGSNQGFMEEKVLGGPGPDGGALGAKNPLFGRRTAQIHLQPFDYLDAARMLPGTEPERLVEYYACFGGTPYYLSMIDESESIEENVARLFFSKEGLLYEEPIMLLRQELREPALYSSIMDAIAGGANRPQAIADRVGDSRTTVGKYLETLRSMGLVSRIAPFGESSRSSRKCIYRLSDPCFSFWYGFVQPAIDTIERDAGELVAREAMRTERLSTHVGHWFEAICLSWTIRQALAGSLPFSPTAFGSWWGTNARRHERDDVDVMASNDRLGQLLVGECKWRNGFDESDALERLDERAALFPEYGEVWRALFTKLAVSSGTVKRHDDGRTLFVSTEELYANR